MLDDVSDFGGLQPEVDRHADASVRGDAEEQLEHPGRVLADDGDPLAACRRPSSSSPPQAPGSARRSGR